MKNKRKTPRKDSEEKSSYLTNKRSFPRRKVLIGIYLILVVLGILIAGGLISIGDVFIHHKRQFMIGLIVYVFLVLIYYFFFRKWHSTEDERWTFALGTAMFLLLFPSAYISVRLPLNVTRNTICVATYARIVDAKGGKIPSIYVRFKVDNMLVTRRINKTNKQIRLRASEKKNKKLIGDTIIIHYPVNCYDSAFILLKEGKPDSERIKQFKKSYYYFNRKYYRTYDDIPTPIQEANNKYLFGNRILNIHWYKFKPSIANDAEDLVKKEPKNAIL